MAFTAHLDCACPRFLAGVRPGFVIIRDEQESRSVACQSRCGRKLCCDFPSISRIMRGTSFHRKPFVTFLTSSWKQHQRTQIRVAAEHSDSKPEASSSFGDLGYHPLEDIPSFERKKSIDQADRRLSDAEVARTLVEGNQNAIIYASMEDEDHVFGTEVQYLVDEHGDFYFQIDEDSEFLTSLQSAHGYVNVTIGYKDIAEWMLEQQETTDGPQEEASDIDSSDEDSSDDDEEDDDGQTWIVVASEGAELVLEEMEDDSSSSAGDWSGLDTLASIHPLDFAESIARAVAANHEAKIEKPLKSLRMVGELCLLNNDEEEYVQRLFKERFHEDEDEDDEMSEEVEEEGEKDEEQTDYDQSMEKIEGTVTGEIVMDDNTFSGHVSAAADAVTQREDTEEAEVSNVKMVFYKLEIQHIFVSYGCGAQTSVTKTEFQMAKPDILIHCASSMMERLNACGKALEDALKLLCLQKKGIEAEEVSLLEVDSLGLGLRVHCGREVQTLRIPFSQRATSVEHAEQLLDQLFNPRVQHKARRKRRSVPQGKSF